MSKENKTSTVTQDQISQYHEHTNKLIRDSGFVTQAVMEVGLYTIGLITRHGVEIVADQYHTKVKHGCINEAYKSGDITPNKVYTSNEHCVHTSNGVQDSRYQFIKVPEKFNQTLCEKFAFGFASRYEMTSENSFLVVQLSDMENRLPGEEGYDWYDQSPEAVVTSILTALIVLDSYAPSEGKK